MVSVAAEGASSVVGGNRQIFESFAKHSYATIKLNHKVLSLAQLDGEPSTWELTSTSAQDLQSKMYDIVVLAAPYHQTGISIVTSSPLHIPDQPYSHLHVTLVMTNATAPRSCYFNPTWACKDAAPTTVLSTFAPFEAGLSPEPRLNSLNYLRELDECKYAVKSASFPLLYDVIKEDR